ncbi:MAG: prolyl oligopeptidase family serine peptidase [Planctomycetota bacterium]
MPLRRSRFVGRLVVMLTLAVVPGVFAQPEAPQPPAVPDDVERHRVGDFVLTQPGVPKALYQEVLREYGLQSRAVYREVLDQQRPYVANPLMPDQDTTWQVSVPDTYAPGDTHGVLVFIHAADSGQVHPFIHAQLGERKLIAIGANHTGNKQDTAFRHAAAVHAVDLIRDRYDIDEDRVYVHGLSGGGRMSSRVIFIHGHVFDGAICLIGVDPYLQIPSGRGANTVFRGFWRKGTRKRLDHIRQNNRLVLVTGEHDANRHGTLQVFKAYEKQGFAHLTYLEEPGLGHAWPSDNFLSQAMDLLDAPLYEGLDEAYRQARDAELDGDLGAARVGYARAARYGRDQPWLEDARAKAAEFQTRHDADLAALNVMFADAAVSKSDLVKAINRFRKTWGRDGPVVDELRRRVAEHGDGSGPSYTPR